MSVRVRVAAVDDIPWGAGKEFVANGRLLAVYRLESGLFALDGVCPHAGGPLAEGMVRGTTVTCPWHGWQFDVTSGRHCLNANLKHASFPTSVENGDVWVELPE